MPYTFTDATLLTYKLNKNSLGEGLASLNERIDITIKGILDNRSSNLAGKGVKESINDINALLLTTSNVYDDIIVNNFNLGKGIITNISFPNDNPIRIADYEYQIEVIKNTDFSNFNTSDTIYGSTLFNLKNLINNFEEKFDFSYEENGVYKCQHTINLQYFNDKTDVINKSKELANTLFNEALALGLIGKFAYSYSNLRTKKNYYSENYDLINKRCSFIKEIEINENATSNYFNKVSHSLTLQADGKINIQEQGLIKSLDNDSSFNAENYFNDELNKAFSRCNSVFNSYTSKYNMGVKDSLKNIPNELGKTLNLADNSLEYSVTYTNAPAFEGNLVNNYSITISQNSNNVNAYLEQGDIYYVGQVGSVPNLNQFKLKYLQALSRAQTYYPTYKLTNSSINIEKFSNFYGNKFSYKIERSNDEKIISSDDPDSRLYKNIDISIEDTSPSEMYKEYVIANRNPKNIFFVLGNQLNMGARKVSIKGTLARSSSDPWRTPTVLPLDDLKAKAISNGLSSISQDAYISEVSYSYDSQYGFSFDVTFMYLM